MGAARASTAVAGRGGRPRTERSEGGGSRSPERIFLAQRDKKAAQGQPMSTASTNPSGFQGPQALGAWGVQGGCRIAAPLPKRSGQGEIERKSSSGCTTEKRPQSLFPKNSDDAGPKKYRAFLQKHYERTAASKTCFNIQRRAPRFQYPPAPAPSSITARAFSSSARPFPPRPGSRESGFCS